MCFYISVRLLSFIIVALSLLKEGYCNIYQVRCKSNEDFDVDWWYMYKPPNSEASPYTDSGRNFTFIASNRPGRWLPSYKAINDPNMLYFSLRPLYKNIFRDHVAHMVFRDSEIKTPKAKGRGFLLADKSGGVFIMHTVPNLDRFSDGEFRFPYDELRFGHLMMCYSLDLSSINDMANLIKRSGVQITHVHIPSNLREHLPSWTNLSSHDGGMKRDDPMEPLTFVIPEELFGVVLIRPPGHIFCLYKTFSIRQNIILDVYSPNWSLRRFNHCDKTHGTRRIESISLKIRSELVQYVDNRTDFSRFAVSANYLGTNPLMKTTLKNEFWTCICTLDKDDHSEKGGIIFCVNNYQVWGSFDNLKITEPHCT